MEEEPTADKFSEQANGNFLNMFDPVIENVENFPLMS